MSRGELKNTSENEERKGEEKKFLGGLIIIQLFYFQLRALHGCKGPGGQSHHRLTSLLREAADLSSIPATVQYIQNFLGGHSQSYSSVFWHSVFWQGGRRRSGGRENEKGGKFIFQDLDRDFSLMFKVVEQS